MACACKYGSICSEWKTEGEEVDDFGVTSKKQVCKIAYGNKLSSILHITNTYGYMC